MEPDQKFAFGRNWQNFLQSLDETKIAAAEDSLRRLLDVQQLQGQRFIDAGSGSGLFSLAAYRLGAEVISFDVDADSVACTDWVRREFGAEDRWKVSSGSLLDAAFLEALPDANIVYCWGVAHHTGQMWVALGSLAEMVSPRGKLVVAIYNDQQYRSRMWHSIKRIYQRLPSWLRPVYVSLIWVGLFSQRAMMTLAASVIRLVTLRNPFVPWVNWIGQSRGRGMNRWYDLVDWVGGWPFEVARPEEIFRFYRDRGFELREMTTSDGHGCNEFVFERSA